MTDTLTPSLIVAIGERDIPGAKRFFGFIPLDLLTDDVDGPTIDRKASWYSGKNAQKCLVGGVYEAKCKIDTGKIRTIAFGRMKLQKRIDHPLTPAWEMHTRVAQDHARSESQLRKVKSEPLVLKEIHHLREMYRSTAPSLRGAFELAILRMIRGA